MRESRRRRRRQRGEWGVPLSSRLGGLGNDVSSSQRRQKRFCCFLSVSERLLLQCLFATQRLVSGRLQYTKQYKQNLRNNNLGYNKRRDLTIILFSLLVKSSPQVCVFTVISSQYSPRYLCTYFLGHHEVLLNPSNTLWLRAQTARGDFLLIVALFEMCDAVAL